MSRPATVADLSSYDTDDHDFLHADLNYLTRDVKVGAAVLTLISACRESDAFTVKEDSGSITVTVPLSADEKLKRLRTRQKSWDDRADWYARAVADPEGTVTEWWKPYLDSWVLEEGRTPIAWPTENEVQA